MRYAAFLPTLPLRENPSSKHPSPATSHFIPPSGVPNASRVSSPAVANSSQMSAMASSGSPVPPSSATSSATQPPPPPPPAPAVAPPGLKFKDCTGIVPICTFRDYDSLARDLLGPDVVIGPQDNGTLDLIVLRPKVNMRTVVNRAPATREEGIPGSGWKRTEIKGLTDQICVMPSKVIREVSKSDDPEIWAPAGDQLFVDMDLSKENFEVGDRVRVGEQVVLEVTKKPHLGCMKFIARYGADSLKVLNSPEGKKRRLRGIYFEVVTDGVMTAGDKIVKVARDAV